MSLRPRLGSHVPEETARVTRAAFPKGNPSLTLPDKLETLDADRFFKDLFPKGPVSHAWTSGRIFRTSCAGGGLAMC